MQMRSVFVEPPLWQNVIRCSDRDIDLRDFKVARYSFSGSIPPKCERELRRHLQRFGEINSTVVLDKDETLL